MMKSVDNIISYYMIVNVVIVINISKVKFEIILLVFKMHLRPKQIQLSDFLD